MPKKEAPITRLQDYLPPGTFDKVLEYLQVYHVHLTVTPGRRSILGDYRHRTREQNHRITVNGNLNTYAFLITLIHEIAHLLQFEQYGNRVASHGKEWKSIFGKLLFEFLQNKVFPADIEKALLASIHNPAASSCADEVLLRTLKNYDKESHLVMVEQLKPGGLFKTPDGKIFRKEEKLRKRFRCTEVKTGREYLFSPVYEVLEIAER
jgi:SprT protein